MKIEVLRKKTKAQLEKLLTGKREQLRKSRFDLASGKLKNVREIHSLKKDIAQIQTLLKEK